VADITIARVRPDLLGTYGDGGNAIVLARRVEWRGGTARLVDVLDRQPLPDDTDIVVMGGGEDAAQSLLLRDQVLTGSLVERIGSGITVLAVCAGLQLLGTGALVPGQVPERNALGLIDMHTRRLPQRAVGEVVAEATAPIGLLTGFENHQYGTVLGPGVAPLARVQRGVGNGTDDHTDGVRAGNVFGTYLHGPVLARNPALADHLLATVLGPLEPLDDTDVNRLRRSLLGRHR
jgi:CobQ-like glutamine amidotransferase family enzyme